MMNPQNIIYLLAGSNSPILDHVTVVSECSTLIQSSIGYPTNSSFFLMVISLQRTLVAALTRMLLI